MPVFRILFDGWPLVYSPISPASLHLLTILAYLPQDVEAVIALPAPKPPWLPSSLATFLQPTQDTPRQKVLWQQWTLPRLQKTLSTNLIHLVQETPSLFYGSRTLVSPTNHYPGASLSLAGFIERLGQALAQGGLVQARGVIWPVELPKPPRFTNLLTLPLAVHPAFRPNPKPEIPKLPGLDLFDGFVLYHYTRCLEVLSRVLRAWTWPASAIGQMHPLLIIGLDAPKQHLAKEWIAEHELENSVFLAPSLVPMDLPPLYQAASAVFSPSDTSPWGDPIQHALACHKPVISLETPRNNALVGSAAFLQPADNIRELGAAVITVLVQEDLGEQLAKAAAERSAGWQGVNFQSGLMRVYQDIQTGF